MFARTFFRGVLLGVRWYESYQMGIGRIPVTNLYESLVFFAWSVNLFYLVVERKFHNRTFGAFVMPIAFFMMVFAVDNDSGIHLLPMPWPPMNPAGSKLDPRAENTEKGNLARSQIPFTIGAVPGQFCCLFTRASLLHGGKSEILSWHHPENVFAFLLEPKSAIPQTHLKEKAGLRQRSITGGIRQ